jgi:trk system potassium uptake protein TrkA
MFVLIVGCGRTGSSLAAAMLADGHEVSCLDEDPEAEGRLQAVVGKDFSDAGGTLTIGTALEASALEAAGISKADVFIASTDGDNTNIVIAQIAERKYEVETVIARVMDPLRAEWYAKRGLTTVCPTRAAIELLQGRVRAMASGMDD